MMKASRTLATLTYGQRLNEYVTEFTHASHLLHFHKLLEGIMGGRVDGRDLTDLGYYVRQMWLCTWANKRLF